MINVTLKGGVIKQYENGTNAAEVAKNLGESLYKAACGCKIDGVVSDLRTPIKADCSLEILTFDTPEGKKIFWHTSTHIMAQAVKRLYPDVKLATGPALDNGFFYDFATDKPFTTDDLSKIEIEMKKIVESGLKIERSELSTEEAIDLEEKNKEPLKVELVHDKSGHGKVLTFYSHGEFSDLCSGPHLLSVSAVKAFSLTQTTGAYWKGDANNAQLSRIYGVSFPKASMLKEHLEAVEEAKKRDHNLIGRQLGFFTTTDAVGQGLPLLMPKGAKVIQILSRFVEDEEEQRGYVLTKTPFMAKSDLYKLSGHWDHYKDGMFILGDETKEGSEIFALRPMTCPFQFSIYNAEMHSYRDLPIRYNETSTLFRNESSGEMHGLIRVRQFTLSEGHLVCRPDQVADEFYGVMDLINYMMKTLDITDSITYRCSLHDPADMHKYVNNPAAWEATERELIAILDNLSIPYTTAIGEAAFYGPKLDIQFKNVHGKEDTLITVQIDFCLGERLNMTYVDVDGVKKHPTVIHRSSIGCYERTLAMLIEKHAGALPLWLSPEQVRVLPISDKQADGAHEIYKSLIKNGIRAKIDTRQEKIGYKIREAQIEKVPYMLVIGGKELEDGVVSVRDRKQGDIGTFALNDFINKCAEEITKKY